MELLDNLIGATTAVELAEEEERLSKARAMQLWDDGLIDELVPGTVECLFEIHRHLFQDVHVFAGKQRTENIAKDNFRFAHVAYLDDQLRHINKFEDSTLPQIVEKYAELNIAHPFREGNGRALRLWLDILLDKRLGLRVQWGNISRDDYMQAMIRSHVNTTELRVLLEDNMVPSSDQTREIFAHSVNTSYFYEGYATFDANTLD